MRSRSALFAFAVWMIGVTARAERLDPLMPLLADLAGRGGYGVRDSEQGAFLVDDGGQVRCVLWNFTNEFHRASFAAAMPQGTIAIAHTHPRCCREISLHDQDEATRLGIPVIAVSYGTVQLVEGDGTLSTLRRGVDWAHYADGRRRCEGPDGRR